MIASIYREGKQAYKDGLPPTDNPYLGDRHDFVSDWQAGYDCARHGHNNESTLQMPGENHTLHINLSIEVIYIDLSPKFIDVILSGDIDLKSVARADVVVSVINGSDILAYRYGKLYFPTTDLLLDHITEQLKMAIENEIGLEPD